MSLKDRLQQARWIKMNEMTANIQIKRLNLRHIELTVFVIRKDIKIKLQHRHISENLLDMYPTITENLLYPIEGIRVYHG